MSISSAAKSDPHRGILLGCVMICLVVAHSTVNIPFLEIRRDRLGCDALCQGGITSLTSGCSLFGASVIGRASDYYGRKPMLWIGLIGALVTVMLNMLETLTSMAIAVGIGTLLNQSVPITKALFAEYNTDAGGTDEDLVGAVGKLGMALGLSFVAGPVLGTLLASDFEGAQIISGGLLLASGIIVAVLPQPQAHKRTDNHQTTWRFWRLPVLQTRGAQVITMIRLLLAMGFHFFLPVWRVSLKNRFSLGPKDHAQFMGFVGILYALSQGVIAKFLLKRAGRNTTNLLLVCISLLGGLRPLALWTNSKSVVYMLYTPMIISLGVVNTAITTACSLLADKSQLGGLFGFLESVENMAGIICPTLGGLFAKWSDDLPLAVVCSCYGLTFLLVLLFFHDHVALNKLEDAATSKKVE